MAQEMGKRLGQRSILQ
ncbi:hypothetical protein M8010_05920 [Marinobacter sp. ATCH36]|nr:hypothetical protein [Marinobacter sp. ATCH36]MCL7943512.1 hypothetical protein [Marinobacter sp. ATCH36]